MALSRGIGIIKCWFSDQGGCYGFIHPESGGEAIFVHHTAIATPAKEAGSLSEGARVTYEVVRKGMAGLWAKNVSRAD